MRPARFRVDYESKRRVDAYLLAHPDDPNLEAADPFQLLESEEWHSIVAARKRAQAVARENDCTVLIYERLGIHDVTPPEDPPGLIWDWDAEELVAEVQPWEAGDRRAS